MTNTEVKRVSADEEPALLHAAPSGRARAWTLGVGLAGIAALMVLGVLVRIRVPTIDAFVLRRAHADPTSSLGQLAIAVTGVSTLVGLGTLVIAAVRVWWQRRGRVAGLLLRYAVVLVSCCGVLLLQNVFQRPGPSVGLDWTYPSGHGVVATAVAVTTVLLARPFVPRWRAAVLTLVTASVLLIAVGRLVLGEHYLTDVVGAVIGTTGMGLLIAVLLKLLPTPSSEKWWSTKRSRPAA